MSRTAITREEVVEAENQLFAAQRISDVDKLDQLLHDKLIALSPSGQCLTKEMDLTAHRAKLMVIEEASTAIEDVRLIDDTAVSLVSMKAKGTMMGAPVEGHFRYLRVWKRFEEGLKVIGASFMQVS